MMLQISLILILSLSALPSYHAFWDGGHMLVAEVAKQYLEASGDLAPILTLLQASDGISGSETSFHDFADSAVWMDQIKCSRASPNCPLPTLPAFTLFNNWHYGGRCIAVNGYPEVANPCPGTDRMDAGLILNALAEAIATISSTRSIPAAAMSVRIILHLMGDIHQPMHCAGGAVDASWPQGDQGGNLRRFNTSVCSSPNMHMLWDSGGLKYTANWSPEGYPLLYSLLRINATSLIASGAGLPDALGFNGLDGIPFHQFVQASQGDYGFFGRILHEQGEIAKHVAYGRGIHLTPWFLGGPLDCPDELYFDTVRNVTDANIGRAGYRLYHVLKQVSSYVVRSGMILSPPHPPGPAGRSPAARLAALDVLEASASAA